MCTKCLSGNIKGREHLEDLSINGRLICNWNTKKSNGRVRTRFIWLRIGISVGLL
jgi:hypothetical protein